MLTEDELFSRLEAAERCPRRSGSSIQFRCPFPESHAHGDHDPSCNAFKGKNGAWRFKCHTCDAPPDEIERELGLSREDLLPGSSSTGRRQRSSSQTQAAKRGEDLEEVLRRRGELAAAYVYRDVDGRVAYKVVRTRDKKFRQERPDPSCSGQWIYKKPERTLPYMFPKVCAAIAAGTQIVWCEGEKDVESVTDRLGLPATTTSGGSSALGSVRDDVWESFRGAEIVILPDHDAPGEKYAMAVMEKLLEHGARSVRVVRLYSDELIAAAGADISDWLEAGNTLKDLEAIIAATPSEIPKLPVHNLVVECEGAYHDRLSHRYFAREFADRHRGRILHSNALGWCVWDGKVWRTLAAKQVEDLAKEMGQVCRDMVRKCGMRNEKVVSAFFGFARRSLESRAGVKAIEELARSEPALDADRLKINFDGKPDLITLSNGTLDLKTGQFRDHDSPDFITKLCPTRYNPKARCPEFEKFMGQLFLGDQRLIEYVCWALGYSLSGNTDHHLFIICHGGGANGKTTLLRLVERIAGEDYAHTVNPETFLQQKYAQHGTERAALRGKRLVIASETPKGRQLNEAFIKELTGAEKITGRFMRQDEMSFYSTAKPWLLTNDLPILRDTSHGLRRRIRLIPFEARFSKEDGNLDARIADRLFDEREGILARLLRAYRDSIDEEPNVPERIRIKTDEYFESYSPIHRFVKECCELDEQATVSKSELYDAFRTWAGSAEISKVAFGKELSTMIKSITNGRSSTERSWKGIKLLGNVSSGRRSQRRGV